MARPSPAPVVLVAVALLWGGCEEGGRTGAGDGGPAREPQVRERAGAEADAAPTEVGARRDAGRRPDGSGSSKATFPLHGVALFHQVNIYSEPSSRSERLGYLRRGSRIRLGPAVEGRGCREGRWHPTAGGGYVCSGRTMRVGEEPPPLGFTPTAADLDAPTPYEYGFNRAEGVPLYRRLPTRAEMRAEEERRRMLLAEKQAAAAGPGDGGPAPAATEAGPGPAAASPDPAAGEPEGEAEEEEEEEEEEPTGPIVTRLKRGFYVTIEQVVAHEGRRWVRTAALHYVSAEGIHKRLVPDIHGVELGEELSLPLAIVYKDGARTRRPGRGARPEKGRELERFDAVPVAGVARLGADRYYATGQGDLVPADRVRRIDPVDPPPDIAPEERWIDVDLSSQTLVAYEGSRPVYATLVATGKPGFETPTGEYRLESKHVSTNMSDAPTGDEPYLIEDVPWTMYFQGAFALHGAFWHSRFGKVRSHGCVNLAPADARWLFFWVGPRLPEGWHGVTATPDNPGTRVYIHN